MDSLTARWRVGRCFALLLFCLFSCSSSPSATGSQEGEKPARVFSRPQARRAATQRGITKTSDHQGHMMQHTSPEARYKQGKVLSWWRKTPGTLWNLPQMSTEVMWSRGPSNGWDAVGTQTVCLQSAAGSRRLVRCQRCPVMAARWVRWERPALIG